MKLEFMGRLTKNLVQPERRLSVYIMSLKKLKKFTPPAMVDLTCKSDDENFEETLEETLAEMDDEIKNQCLVVFFKYLSIFVQGQKKHPKRIFKHPLIDDEVGCKDSDASSDESSKSSTSNVSVFINDDPIPDAGYISQTIVLFPIMFNNSILEVTTNITPVMTMTQTI